MIAAATLYACLLPSALANQALSIPTNQQKGETILTSVMGLNSADIQSSVLPDAQFESALPTQTIRYNVQVKNDKVELLDTFVNGSLKMMYVLTNTEAPNVTASTVEQAKAFLTNYQVYANNDFYGQLALMMSKGEPTKNSTAIVGDIKYDVTVVAGKTWLDKSATYTWSFTANGVDASYKCVSLNYEKGLLKCFLDTWNLYQVGSTKVNISEEQAQEIALKSAAGYNWTVNSGNQTYVVEDFKVTKPIISYIVYCESGNLPTSPSNDPMALYPMWRIGVGLDKYYPGNVYGLYVDVWADSGQVRDIQEAISTLPESVNPSAIAANVTGSKESNIAQSNLLWATPIIGSIATFSAILTIRLRMTNKSKPARLFPKLKLRKISGTILCAIICSTTLLVLGSAVPVTSAGTALIWGNNHPLIPPYYPNPHTSEETQYQQMISATISSWFASYGYTSLNMQGAATNTFNIIPYTNYYSQNSASEATVWFDHGIGLPNSVSQPVLNQIQGWQNYPNEFHFMLSGSDAIENDPAKDVFDYQIYDATTGNNYFSFVSACLTSALNVPSGNGYTGTYGLNQDGTGSIVGMPFAFTHTTDLSLDGYANPDTSPYCYIGYDWGSAALSQTIASYWPTSTYYDFVYAFFYYALVAHTTVNQALDSAAYMVFTPNNYAGTSLYSGFTGVWPYCGGEEPNCHMRVYGNGNIYLGSSNPQCVTPPSVTSDVPWPAFINNNYQFTACSVDSYDHNQNIQYLFNWGDNSYNSAQNPSGQQVQAYHYWTSPGAYTVVVTAQSDDGVQSNPTYYTVNVLSPVTHLLNVQATDYYTIVNPNVYVDGNWVGTAPLTVSVNEGWHDIEVDGTVWNWQWNCYEYFQYMTSDDGYNAYSGSWIPIYHDMYSTAIYWW